MNAHINEYIPVFNTFIVKLDKSLFGIHMFFVRCRQPECLNEISFRKHVISISKSHFVLEKEKGIVTMLVVKYFVFN